MKKKTAEIVYEEKNCWNSLWRKKLLKYVKKELMKYSVKKEPLK
jgi:hypothetical protein